MSLPSASRAPLRDLSQNIINISAGSDDGALSSGPIKQQPLHGKPLGSGTHGIKPSMGGIENAGNLSDQVAEDYAKLLRERDNLADEVRKLTRQNAQLMNADQSSSWQKIMASNRELRRLEDNLSEVKQALEVERQGNMSLQASVEEYKKEVFVVDTLRSELASYKETITKLVAAREQAIKAHNEVKEELAALKESSTQFIMEMQSRLEELESSNAELQQELKVAKEERPALPTNMDDMEPEMLASITSTVVKDLQDKLLKSETIRKQLLNKVHELKGNIRVFVRCRPFLPNDGVTDLADTSASPLLCCEETNDINISSMLAKAGTSQMFHFDQVFGQKSSQNQIFDSVSDLIQSALDGYRVCIFCYGQTGSGKTHTMSGSPASVDSWGIIPRAVQKMIQDVASMREAGWGITLKASMLEVYNETIRDILSCQEESTIASGADDKQTHNKYRINFANGKVSVSDVISVQIDTSTVRSGMKKLHEIMLLGSKNRMVASTSMNDRSSRSHLLFYLDVSGHHPGRNTWMEGGLRLVDLAGSERLDRCGTGNDANRFRETVSINKSLSSLGEVFLSLGNKSAHVPYRNSKLTMLLQDCLSGEGKALMFANVSPTQESLQETLCSLRFASQVNSVELGQARKSVYRGPVAAPAKSSAPAQSAAVVTSEIDVVNQRSTSTVVNTKAGVVTEDVVTTSSRSRRMSVMASGPVASHRRLEATATAPPPHPPVPRMPTHIAIEAASDDCQSSETAADISSDNHAVISGEIGSVSQQSVQASIAGVKRSIHAITNKGGLISSTVTTSTSVSANIQQISSTTSSLAASSSSSAAANALAAALARKKARTSTWR